MSCVCFYVFVDVFEVDFCVSIECYFFDYFDELEVYIVVEFI